jgi:hypothetical protein
MPLLRQVKIGLRRDEDCRYVIQGVLLLQTISTPVDEKFVKTHS